MEPSPLTQQERPTVFVQKVVGLYEALFMVRYGNCQALRYEADQSLG